MRTLIIFTICLTPLLAEAQIFKCTEADGSISFSYAPCKGESGKSEYIKVQTNEMGTFATPDQVRQQQIDSAATAGRSQQRVTVVTDSATEDQSTLDGVVNKRLRLKEEALEQQRKPSAGSVTVVGDSGNESQFEKAYRLKQEAAALNYSTPDAAPTTMDDLDYEPPEINSREVPYAVGQNELQRNLKQIQNKMDDPRAADFSKKSCSDARSPSKAVKIRGKKVWPGMSSNEVRRLIGSPDTVNSVLVGMEQWAYRDRDGGTTYVRINGRCVSAIE